MRCPNCDSEANSRFRAPVEREGVILRRHQCSNCRHVFLSAQVVVTAELEEQLLEEFEQ